MIVKIVNHKKQLVIQILIPVCISIILLITGNILIVKIVKHLLINERKRDSMEKVNSVYNMINNYYRLTENGQVTQEQAKQTIKLIIKNLKYGEDEKEYFWLLDHDNHIISHPYFNDSITIERLKPIEKSTLIRLVTEAKNKGETFVQYYWQWKDDTSRIELKISYVKNFDPWHWVIGTGFYKADVDTQIKKLVQYMVIIILIILSILILLLLFILRKSLLNLNEIMQKEDLLRKSEKSFKGMASNINSGLIILEADKVVFSNKLINKIFGVDLSLNERFSILDYVIEEEYERVCFLFEESERTQVPVCEIECWVWSANEAKKYLLCSFSYEERENILCTYILITDNTEKKQAEIKIKSLSETLSQVPDSIILADLLGNIIYVNHQFELNTGYKSEEVFGKNPRIFKSNKMPDIIYQNMWETITSGKIWKGELLNKKKNGELYWEYTIIFPVMNNRGEIFNYASIKTDLTKEKFLEKELNHFKEAAKISDNLKIAFLNNISHEVLTPLNAIYGYTQILGEVLKDNTASKNYLINIQNNAEILLKLFEEIINYASIEAGDIKITKEELSLNTFIKELISKFNVEISTKANKPIEIVLDENNHYSQAVITTDKSSLTMIFENIISNAIKFTIKGSINIGYSIDYENIVFYVRDTGVGIPESEYDRIFEMFTHGSNLFISLHKGTGLGLNISNRLLKILGGRLWFTSEENVGTIFYFSLPSIDVKNYIIDNVQVTNFPYSDLLDNKKIIIAEDNDEYFNYINSLLTGKDLEVSWVKSNLELLNILGIKEKRFDLIILDKIMSFYDGLNTIKTIKSTVNDIPIVLIADDEKMISDEDKLLCQSILLKPFSKNILFKTLSAILNSV
jgi:PAS domain S-box-containing protein